MHSTPRKKRQRIHVGTATDRSAWPTHSQMGNPYPKGLEPCIIEYGPPDKPNHWPQPLDEAQITPPDGIVSDYLYVESDPQQPRLKLRLAPRGADQTDEQYEAYRRDIEQFTCTHAYYLGLCQMLCTHLGNHHACAEGPAGATALAWAFAIRTASKYLWCYSLLACRSTRRSS